MKRVIITLLSVLALAFAFAGCGGSDSGSASDKVVTTINDNVDAVEAAVEAPEKVDAKVAIEDSLGPVPAIPGT